MKQLLFCIFLLLLEGCSSNQPPAVSGQIDELPAIYPDYIDVTIPQSIAPLNFAVQTEGKACAVFTTEGYAFSIPNTDWENLFTAAKGKQVEVSVLTEEKGKWNAFLPFHIRVSEDPIDPYIAYRLIDPGYQLWNEMGIYQRELSSFDQEPILENRLTDNNCMNCHSFCMQNPDRMLFHQRALHAGTYILTDGDIEKLDTKTERTISALVYPAWHPSGRYVAFSTNDTKQDFHLSDAPAEGRAPLPDARASRCGARHALPRGKGADQLVFWSAGRRGGSQQPVWRARALFRHSLRMADGCISVPHRRAGCLSHIGKSATTCKA